MPRGAAATSRREAAGGKEQQGTRQRTCAETRAGTRKLCRQSTAQRAASTQQNMRHSERCGMVSTRGTRERASVRAAGQTARARAHLCELGQLDRVLLRHGRLRCERQLTRTAANAWVTRGEGLSALTQQPRRAWMPRLGDLVSLIVCTHPLGRPCTPIRVYRLQGGSVSRSRQTRVAVSSRHVSAPKYRTEAHRTSK